MVQMAERMDELVERLLRMPQEEKARRAEEAIKAYARRRATKRTKSP